MVDVLGGQQLRQLGFDRLQLSELLDVGQLRGVDRSILVLVEDEDVDDADRPGIDELQKLCRHLAGEALRAGRKLNHHVVNGAEFVKRCVRHRCPFSRLPSLRLPAMCAPTRAARWTGPRAAERSGVWGPDYPRATYGLANPPPSSDLGEPVGRVIREYRPGPVGR